MKIRLAILFILGFRIVMAQQPDTTQLDIVDVLFGKNKKKEVDTYRSGKKVHFSILPAAVNIAGGGRAVVTAVNAAFYLGEPSETNLSNIYLIPYTNFGGRYGLYVRPNLWLQGNSFNLQGDYRIARFPQETWGLGGGTPEWDKSLIDADYVRLYQSIFKKIFHNWYAGPGYALDHHYNIKETDFVGSGHLERYRDDSLSATTSSGLTLNFVHDSRVNAINPDQGAYLIVSWRGNFTSWGSTYTNQSLFIDGRKYWSISSTKYHILAFRSYYWTVLNGVTPYLDLPATNWAPASGIGGRGFPTGRYRSNAMLYGEAEQRYQISYNGMLGFVVFANIASASEYGTQQFKFWELGTGFGIRLKLNKYSETNIAADLGFSKNYWGFWLNIGEMF